MPAVQKLISYWEADKENTRLILDIVFHLTASGEFSKAKEFYLSLPEQVQNHPECRWQLGNLLLLEGDISGAQDVFHQLDENAQLSRAFGLSLCAFAQQRYADIVNLLEPGLRQKNQQAVPLDRFKLIARAKYFLGDLAGAQHDLEPFLRNANDAEFLGLAAMLAVDSNQLEQATELANQALKLNPEQHDGLLARASIELQQHQAHKALLSASQGQAKYPSSGRFWLIAAQAQLLCNAVAEAQKSATTACHLLPTHIGSWHVKAWCELLLEQFDAALAAFQQALQLDRNFAETQGGVAVALCKLKRWQEAQEKSEIALRLDRNCLSGRFAKSLLLEHSGAQDQAKALMADLMDSPSSSGHLSYANIIEAYVESQPKQVRDGH